MYFMRKIKMLYLDVVAFEGLTDWPKSYRVAALRIILKINRTTTFLNIFFIRDCALSFLVVISFRVTYWIYSLKPPQENNEASLKMTTWLALFFQVLMLHTKHTSVCLYLSKCWTDMVLLSCEASHISIFGEGISPSQEGSPLEP